MRRLLALILLCVFGVTHAVTPQQFLLAQANGITLLSYIAGLGGSGTSVLSGATIDFFTNTGTATWNTTTYTTNTGTPATFTSSNFASLTVTDFNGINTGKLPALINVQACPNCVNGTDTGTNSACTPYPTGSYPSGCGSRFAPEPDSWLTIALGAQSVGAIPFVQLYLRNPAGAGNNPWSTTTCSGGQPAVLTTGCSVQTQLLGDVDQFAQQTALLTKPWILAMFVEANISQCDFSSPLTSFWFSINCSGISSAFLASTSQLIINRLKTDGVKNFLFMWEPNNGVGNYPFGNPGIGYTDLVGWDQPSSNATGTTWFNDTTGYACLQGTGATGCSAFAGLPILFSSLIPSNNSGSCTATPAGSINTATAVGDGLAVYPKMVAYVLWSQCTGFVHQTNATGALSSPYISASGLPSFSKAGGDAGG